MAGDTTKTTATAEILKLGRPTGRDNSPGHVPNNNQPHPEKERLQTKAKCY